MQKLLIPDRLKIEFATIESLWSSSAQTRRVDSLLLSWVKYEKQLRRLFCFLVFQHPRITQESIESVITTMAVNRDLKPETFLAGIESLGVTPVQELLGEHHQRLWREIKLIKRIRNKLMHGQITGMKVTSAQLERNVLLLIEWISTLANAAEATFGYDGIRRNTFRAAKSVQKINIAKYPFSGVGEFKSWLKDFAKHARYQL